MIFTYYLISPLDYTPWRSKKKGEAAGEAFWGFSPAYIVVSHHVSQLTLLSHLSVRQLLWIRECVMWVKWYTFCCISPHQQSGGPWQWFNQPPFALLPKYPSFVYEYEGLCWMLDATCSYDFPWGCRICLMFGSAVVLLLLTHHVFSLGCCWSACIAHQYTLFFMSPASRERNNLFFLLVWWCIYDSITQLV